MSEREWHFYLDDMIVFPENVLTYCDGLDQKTFENTGLNYDATIHNLELIGETANHIPIEVRKTSTSIPWRQIIAPRNRLIHGYLGIDNDILWSIIIDDTPVLLIELHSFKQRIDSKK